MLIRISLILAIIAGLAVGVLNFTQIKDKITTLQKDLKEQTDLKVKALTELPDEEGFDKPLRNSNKPKPLLKQPPKRETRQCRRPRGHHASKQTQRGFEQDSN